jgi:cytochrome c oxidase cbb3-type subunit 3
MSDFISPGWSIYITIMTLVGIAACLWLLFSQRKIAVVHGKDGAVVEDTGHVWDGDLRELNNPLPRWWMLMFFFSCLFALGYLYVFPGLGSSLGSFGYTTKGELKKSMITANAELKPVYDKYMAMTIEQVAADPQAKVMGQRLFLNHCAQCHGSDAGGGKGFPNLTDHDWLYGGEPENILQTINLGRGGVMPAFPQRSATDLVNVATYVRSLSGQPTDGFKVALGMAVFKESCVACHGVDAKGNQLLGAPNLTDKIWLYGGSQATIVETLKKGRQGMMPAQEHVLSPEKIHLLAAFVWGLSNHPSQRPDK